MGDDKELKILVNEGGEDLKNFKRQCSDLKDLMHSALQLKKLKQTVLIYFDIISFK